MENQELWEAYARTRDAGLRNKLIETYYPMARRMAAKVWKTTPAQVELEDLVSMAVSGLIRAVEHFKPDQGVSFETYGPVTIRGGILDEIRAQDWAPRSLRRKMRDINRADEELQLMYGRAPSHDELALFLGIPVEEVVATLKATEATKWRSLDEPSVAADDDDSAAVSRYDHLEDTSNPLPDSHSVASTVFHAVAQVLSQVPPQTAMVVTLYYYERLTMAEVSRIVGIPESKASQLHTNAMLVIRDVMTNTLAA